VVGIFGIDTAFDCMPRKAYRFLRQPERFTCCGRYLVLDYIDAANHLCDRMLDLDIPESGNAIPDILDEALWCAELFRRIQQPDAEIYFDKVKPHILLRQRNT